MCVFALSHFLSFLSLFLLFFHFTLPLPLLPGTHSIYHHIHYIHLLFPFHLSPPSTFQHPRCISLFLTKQANEHTHLSLSIIHHPSPHSFSLSLSSFLLVLSLNVLSFDQGTTFLYLFLRRSPSIYSNGARTLFFSTTFFLLFPSFSSTNKRSVFFLVRISLKVSVCAY